jgi:hypothetical protein
MANCVSWTGRSVIALMLVVCTGASAHAAIFTVYESSGAYTIVEGQELDGKPIDDASLGWTVPVVFPKHIFFFLRRQPAHAAVARVTVTWDVFGSTPAGVPDVIVDGHSVGPAEAFGRAGFIKTVQLSRFLVSDRLHQVSLRLLKGGNVFTSIGNTIIVHPVSPFILIERTFRHDRCSNCHSLQSSEAIHAFHSGFGVDLPDDPNVRPGTGVVCMGCHDVSFTGVQSWMSPPADRALNFREVPGTRALCESLVDLLSMANSKDPPFDVIAKHFRNDQRIRWALENGQVPLDLPPLPKAPPYSSDLFGDLADWWVFWGRFGKFCDGLE